MNLLSLLTTYQLALILLLVLAVVALIVVAIKSVEQSVLLSFGEDKYPHINLNTVLIAVVGFMTLLLILILQSA